jgi:hypothetical protein
MWIKAFAEWSWQALLGYWPPDEAGQRRRRRRRPGRRRSRRAPRAVSRASRALGPGRGRRRGCCGRTSFHECRQRSRPSTSRRSRRRGCRRSGSFCRGSFCRGSRRGSRRGSCRGGSPWFAKPASFLFRGGCRSLARLGLALARPAGGSPARTARPTRLIAADELGVQHLQMGPTARVTASSLAHGALQVGDYTIHGR